MRRLRGVALVVTGVALLAVAAIATVTVVAARSSRLHDALAKALGRQVRVAHMGFTLRGGIGVALSGVEIADDPAADAPEPTLDTEQYTTIISLLTAAGRSVEQSSSRARMLGEEALRDIFLVPLNAHFGAATGEARRPSGVRAAVEATSPPRLPARVAPAPPRHDPVS